jgi:hypothetical protein
MLVIWLEQFGALSVSNQCMAKTRFAALLLGLGVCCWPCLAQEPGAIANALLPAVLSPQDEISKTPAGATFRTQQGSDSSDPTVNAKRSWPANSSGGASILHTYNSQTPTQEPLSVGGKFRIAAKHSVWPEAFLFAGLAAGFQMAFPPSEYPRPWRQGMAAYGRNYGDEFAKQTAAQAGKFVVEALFHEDPRYSPSTGRNVFARTWHALIFTVVDRSDSGRKRLALSNFAGSFSAGFVGTAYLPAGYDNSTHALARSTLVLLTNFAAQNLTSEFMPEIKRAVKKLKIPFVH